MKLNIYSFLPYFTKYIELVQAGPVQGSLPHTETVTENDFFFNSI